MSKLKVKHLTRKRNNQKTRLQIGLSIVGAKIIKILFLTEHCLNNYREI